MATIQVKMDWDAIKVDPVYFAEKLLKDATGNPFKAFEAQANILRNIRRRTVVCTGRQFSKTTAMAIKVAHAAITHPGWNICIIAPSLEQARIMWNEVESYFHDGLLGTLVSGKAKQYPFPVLTLKNGATVTARGANSPQFIRGNRFHLIVVDEASFIKADVIEQAIEPTMAVTGNTERFPGAALILCSTPWADGTFRQWHFEAKAEEHDPDLIGFHYTSWDNPHIDRKFLEGVKERYGEDSLVYRTEYMAEFPDNDLAVFPWADIEWATTNYPYIEQSGDHIGMVKFPIPAHEAHKYVQGVDLANMRDYFVSTVLDVHDPRAIPLVRMDRYQKRGYGPIKADIRSNYHSYNHAQTLIDATTLAESVVEDLADIHAEGYKFGGSAAKYEVVQELARMMQERRILLPPNREIIDELRFFEYKLMPSGAVRMEASRGHDDIVMSLSLAAHLANIPRRMGLMQSVNLGRTKPKKEPRKWQISSTSSEQVPA